MKNIRIAGHPDLEECLIKWFKQCRYCNLLIGGNELKEKAEQFAQKLGHKDLKSSNGWLEHFKNRHNIVFRKLCGESQSVSDEFCSEWIKYLFGLLVESESDEEQELHTEIRQCEEWEKISKILNLSKTTTFEIFTEFDTEVQVCRLWTDDEIVSQTISSPSRNEEEVDVPAEPNVTAAQAIDAVPILRSFMECSETVEKEDFAAIFRIEHLVKSNLKRGVARSLCWTSSKEF
ncbi:hypothetical protein AVEN_177695-1 [Araneus ventricosus]|uniref:HTH CENPB-type domain-containing protein n=1 Tax=Araneus ventricosus TaxID=182803 RepID=A0A4Y2M3W2_ARAVE|nr:hypothetical protein AVEN_177695-1 [Araneus ventricosus]